MSDVPCSDACLVWTKLFCKTLLLLATRPAVRGPDGLQHERNIFPSVHRYSIHIHTRRGRPNRDDVKLKVETTSNDHADEILDRRPPRTIAAAAENSLWRSLQDSISHHSLDTPLYRFTVPTLKGGTLDSLLALSDDLIRSNLFIEGASHRIRRQIEDLERDGGAGESGARITVDGVPVDSYLSRFVWDEGKYPTKWPLKDIIASILSRITKIEDEIKVQAAKYNSCKNHLRTIYRKQSVSLVVRDLSNLVKPDDIVTSEHLATLLAIVPKCSQKDWLSCYESLDTFVVPRSSKRLYEDHEYALYTVTLFAKVVGNFKAHAQEKGFLIRDFVYSPEAQESKDDLEKLLQDEEAMRTSLLQLLYARYSEVFSSWMHLCAIFVFAESILRYGLSPSILCVVLAPSTESEKKVRNILEEHCGNANSNDFWKSDDDGVEGETHPYVSSTMNVV